MIVRYILEALIQVAPLSLTAVLILQNRSKSNYLRIFFFSIIFVSYQVILVLPRVFASLNFIKSNWNWTGKLFGIVFGIICYFVFKKYFAPNNFFTFRQSIENKGKTIIVSVTVIVVISVLYYFIGQSDFNIETLVFQLTMPSLDEEIMFRGILLGLLLTALPNKIPILGNPSILLTAILFGFLHALSLNKDYTLSFELTYFLHTGIGGYVFGWIAVKSRSILLPIITHGLTNCLASLSTMIK